ncbi:MAG: hypothetical protein RR588_14935, partial [Solibacillus sp.]
LSKVAISADRLQQLNNIKDLEMENLIQQIKRIKKVAFQEKQIKELVKDIKSFSKKITNL